MDEFIKLINFINTSDIKEEEYLYEPADLIENVRQQAIILFITEEGRCNFENISQARQLGVDIIPLEQDRFGWLIGGIVTKKGIIHFD